MSYKFHQCVGLMALMLLVCGSAIAGGGREFEKTFSKKYLLAKDGAVSVANSFGSVRYSVWDRAEVSFRVRIVVDAGNHEEANATFDRIGINFSNDGQTARAETRIGEASSQSFLGRLMKGEIFGGNQNDNFKVHYEVNLPRSTRLLTEAKHCNVEIGDFAGPTEFNVRFGQLVAGTLAGRNQVEVSFGEYRIEGFGAPSSLRLRHSQGRLGSAGVLTYDGRYSEFEIEEVDVLTLDIGFDDVEVLRATSVEADGNYNELEIDEVKIVRLDNGFSDIELGTVYESLEANVRYGGLSVDRLAAGFQLVEVENSFADVEIDVDDGAAFEVKLRSSNGGVSVKLDGNLIEEASGNTKYVSGTVGRGGRARIEGTAKFGDIKVY